MTETAKKKWLLPESFSKAYLLLWIWVLPQILLLALNLRAWDIVRQEMSTQQRGLAVTIFSYECALLLFGLVSWITYTWRKRDSGIGLCVAIILAHVGYLWLVTAQLNALLPNTVTLWILTPGQFLYYQYALLMPALFYAGLRIACVDMPGKRLPDFGITLAVLVFTPTVAILFLQVFFALLDWAEPPFYVVTLFLVGTTSITLLAFMRVLLFLYAWLRRMQHGWLIIPLFAGVLAPVAGLLLNRRIPFPYNFQDPWVYALAVINGVVLLLPFNTKSVFGKITWGLHSAMYPFTFYFFVVFLPFLPLSLLAMIAFGAGWLILAPTLLFIVHTRKLIDEARSLSATTSRGILLALFVTCVALMPLAYTGRTLWDKHALMQAVDAVYNSDYTDGQVNINLTSARRSLERLRAMKDGIYLPFISDYYNQLVFDGMVLPDRKIEKIYKTLFGEEMPADTSSSLFTGLFNRRSPQNGTRWAINNTMPERNVEIVGIDVEKNTGNRMTRATVALTMQNKGANNSEFVTDLTIPEGVLVSGYWLEIDGERVPGQIIEKKTAMWVYHMIRDIERRDPGLLVFQNDHQLRLNVYPFTREQTRKTGIQFLFPTGMNPDLQIGTETITLSDSANKKSTGIFQTTTAKDTQWLCVSRTAARILPSTNRQAYLHFIVDRSVNSHNLPPDFFYNAKKRITEIFPAAKQCRITIANYEFRHLNKSPVPIDEITTDSFDVSENQMSFRGGFCAERAIKGALLDYKADSPFTENGQPMVPIFIVIRDDDTEIIKDDGLATFADIVPDSPFYYVLREDGKLDRQAFANPEPTTVSEIRSPAPVALFRAGENLAACSATRGGLVSFGPTDNSGVEVFDAEQKRVQKLSDIHTLHSDSIYSEGLSTWDKYRHTVFHPESLNQKLPGIVRDSRKNGVLVPHTSYIVVENSAQREMLKRKEKQALSADQAMEFDEFAESPAPSALYFIPALFFFVYLHNRRKRRMRTTV